MCSYCPPGGRHRQWLGFPGLVLASMLPQASFTLVEQNERRCEFLGRAIDAMRLTNVEIVDNRAQRWRDGAETAELVTARALGRLRVMVKLSAPLLVTGGMTVIFGKPKRDAATEAEAQDVAEVVGLRPVTVHKTAPVGIGARYLYVYEKVTATTATQTRKADRRTTRKMRNRIRAQRVAEAERNAAERLERARGRVQQLETSSPEQPDTAAELERFRAVVQKMERRVDLLAGRRARAEKRLPREEEVRG